ncbi:MAG: hypothetical protein Kow00108_14880 [Calditrichia bacterium]
MIKILTYSKSETFFEDLSFILGNNQFWFEHVSNHRDIQPELVRQYDLVMIHLENELDYLEIKTHDFNHAPVVLLTGNEAKIIQENDILPSCIDIIMLPIPSKEFLQKLKNIAKNLDYYERKNVQPGSTGSLKEFSLLDILQTYMRKDYTGVLTITEREYSGQIFFIDGKIDKIQCEQYIGLEALEALTFLNEGQFEFLAEPLTPSNQIKADMNFIIFHLLDLTSKVESQLPQMPDRWEQLKKNPAMKKDIVYLDEPFKHLYEQLPETFDIMFLLFNKSTESFETVLERTKQLLLQEYIIPASKEEETEISSSKSLWSRLFGSKKEEEPEYIIWDEENESSERKKLIRFPLTQRDFLTIHKIINTGKLS